MWMDEQDPFLERIKKAGNFGLLHRLNPTPPVHVIARGLQPNAMERVRPAYIGARDLV
jgi:hypothetical protein